MIDGIWNLRTYDMSFLSSLSPLSRRRQKKLRLNVKDLIILNYFQGRNLDI